MSELFENFKSVNTGNELKELQEQYKEYDPAYITQAAGVPRKRIKEWLNELWKQYEPYADKDFAEKIKKEFSQRTWEMYLTCALLNRGFTLKKEKVEKTKGPDICLIVGDKNIWVEAVTADVGEGKDKVEIHYDNDIQNIRVYDYPEEQTLLRLRNSLDVKFKKHKEYLGRGLKENEPYIIAVNAGRLLALNPGVPLILKCLFSVGFLTIPIQDANPQTPFWSRREELKKKSGGSVSMGFFENSEHSGVSAVMYCADNILNSPQDKNTMGENFVFALNPLATNPIEERLFDFGQVWKKNNSGIKNLRS